MFALPAATSQQRRGAVAAVLTFHGPSRSPHCEAAGAAGVPPGVCSAAGVRRLHSERNSRSPGWPEGGKCPSSRCPHSARGGRGETHRTPSLPAQWGPCGRPSHWAAACRDSALCRRARRELTRTGGPPQGHLAGRMAPPSLLLTLSSFRALYQLWVLPSPLPHTPHFNGEPQHPLMFSADGNQGSEGTDDLPRSPRA